MQKRLDELEGELLSIYFKIKEILPGLHNLSFDVSTYHSGETSIYGFIHLNKDTSIFNSMEQLCSLVLEKQRKHEILFHRFKKTGY